MEIPTIASFLEYRAKLVQRTDRLVALVPAEHLEWRGRTGSFSIGDTIRHLAAIERYLYADVAAGRPAAYAGCGPELAGGLEQVQRYYHNRRAESTALFSSLADADLSRKCRPPGGGQITLWKWLRALLEHEIHHRGQLYVYLGMVNVAAPPLFGLTSEEVIGLSAP